MYKREFLEESVESNPTKSVVVSTRMRKRKDFCSRKERRLSLGNVYNFRFSGDLSKINLNAKMFWEWVFQQKQGFVRVEKRREEIDIEFCDSTKILWNLENEDTILI